MSRQEAVSQWEQTVSSHFPTLSRPQARVLAWWSFGMVLAKACGIILVCAALALQTGSSEKNLVQRLREWCYASEDKKGEKRRTLDVTTCFGPLLQWILAWWPTDHRQLALALDATTLKKRFTVLCISVVYRGCAIPVAWKVGGAEEKGAWEPHWLKLLTALEDVVPTDFTVIVMSDRGLYAPWLYAKIVEIGWHPFMRINKQGNVRPKGEGTFRSLATAAPTVYHHNHRQVDPRRWARVGSLPARTVANESFGSQKEERKVQGSYGSGGGLRKKPTSESPNLQGSVRIERISI